MLKRYKWSLVTLLLGCLSIAQAAVLDEARVVSASDSLSSMVPQAGSITIATAGTYTLTLTDLGKQPDPDIADVFSSLSVVISQGAQLVKHLAVPSSATTVTGNVVLSVGQYQLQVLGVTSGASLYGVELKDASNVVVCCSPGTITAPSTSNFSPLTQTLAVTAGQTYTVTLTDRAFPVAFTQLLLGVFEAGAIAGNCDLHAAGTCSFVATTNSAVLTVLADKGTNSAGMYSVKVIDSGSSLIYGATLPVGDMPEPVSITLPAGDNYSFSSLDLSTPDPLTSLKLALVQGAEVATLAAAGSAATFAGSSGAASLYAIAAPATGSAGLYSVTLKRGTTTVYSKLNSVTDTVNTGLEGYVFTANLPAAGTYTLQLRDFVFPQAFATLNASVSQDGNILASLAAAGTLTISNAAAGELSIAVLAKPATNSTPGYIPTGLFGISLAASGSSTPLLETTQGVGGSFTSQVVTIPAAAHYAITATDFAAPQALDQLLVVVTRGSTLVGSMYGGGMFEFDPTAGDYTLSFIAKAKTGGYGMYGASLVAAPTVLLSAAATSVASGGSTILTWSSTDASTCTGSGGWSGAKTGSGTSTVGPLTADTTFTLTCTNAAGSTAKSVTITMQIAAASSKKGGGSWSPGWLLLLTLVAGMRQRMPR